MLFASLDEAEDGRRRRAGTAEGISLCFSLQGGRRKRQRTKRRKVESGDLNRGTVIVIVNNKLINNEDSASSGECRIRVLEI